MAMGDKWGSLPAWLAIGATVVSGAVGYGSLQSRVHATEKQLEASKPVAERLATLEANQKNTKAAVDDMKQDVAELNQSIQSVLLELQLQRQAPAAPRR